MHGTNLFPKLLYSAYVVLKVLCVGLAKTFYLYRVVDKISCPQKGIHTSCKYGFTSMVLYNLSMRAN